MNVKITAKMNNIVLMVEFEQPGIQRNLNFNSYHRAQGFKAGTCILNMLGKQRTRIFLIKKYEG